MSSHLLAAGLSQLVKWCSWDSNHICRLSPGYMLITHTPLYRTCLFAHLGEQLLEEGHDLSTEGLVFNTQMRGGKSV